VPSTSILDKPVILETKGKHRDSTGKARAIFLQEISKLMSKRESNKKSRQTVLVESFWNL
jgi:hypothetical protein